MPNRLANEKSPYLLQHAKNPVDWYPWGQEAFDAAIKGDKPVFLSIGYATCHWCHVMERESFESHEIANLLNDNFICIKVDREEHPEVDSIYMEFAQALLGVPAGWPLNLFLTPDLKPFFAATYLPPTPKKGMIGFPQIIEQIKILWNGEDRRLIAEQAEKVVEMFAHTSNATGQELPTTQDISAAADRFFESADPINGGLKGEPKFPLSYQAEFLLAYAKKSGDSRALFYVELTLEMMRRGGIYDQIGGGFSRYSVDERWEIPHFEKMLYDNACLVSSYLQAWKYTKKETYARVCRETCCYLLRDLKHLEGGFYSGEDADSGGYEGLYYTWTPMEVEEAIQNSDRGDDFDLCCAFFDVTHAGGFDGRNVLRLETSEEEFSEAFNIAPAQLAVKISEWKKSLLRRRDTRPRPLRDEKVLVSWNGLAIDALARCGAALEEPSFLQAALQSAAFIRQNLWKEEEGRLLHRWCKGEAKFGALLDDYAFLIKALLTLYEQGCGQEWLDWAVRMAKIVERDFKEIEGAFYQTDGKDPLLLRKCEFYDGAEPSGNAVHAENLLRLHQMTQEEAYLRQAEDILKAARTYIARFAPGASYHLLALQRMLDAAAPTITIALDEKQSLKTEIVKALAVHFCPTAAVIWKKEQATCVTVCRQGKCDAPLTKLDEIVKVIETL